MKLRAKLLAELPGAGPETGMLPDGYELLVSSERTTCCCCPGISLRIVRTYKRRPAGLALGRPLLVHRIKECPQCRRQFLCEELAELLPPHGNYAYDVIVAVGLARYRDGKQDSEIRSSLMKDHRFDLPEGSIHWLANRFLDCFLAVHGACSEALRGMLDRRGGYVMHLDGTCEAGTKVLFVAMDGISGIVLLADTMNSENTADIRTVVDKCIRLFGLPLAVVSDLSNNIGRAVDHLPASTRRLVCHYHFLENIGKKLIQPAHTELNRQIGKSKLCPQLRSLRYGLVTYIAQQNDNAEGDITRLLQVPAALVQDDPIQARRCLAYVLLSWLDDHPSDLHGESFPFDQPALAFYRRVQQLHTWLSEKLERYEFKHCQRKSLQTILQKLCETLAIPALAETAGRLEKAVDAFSELRDTLHFERGENKPARRGSPSSTSVNQAEQIEQRLMNLRKQLKKRIRTNTDQDRIHDAKIVLGYLDKYQDRLHGHVIRPPDTDAVILVEATNNPPEHLFGETKRRWRRRLGTKKLKRRTQAARPAEMILANLKHQDYLDLCYQGDLRNTAATFARHWSEAAEIGRNRPRPSQQSPARVPKASIRKEGFLDTLAHTVGKIAACFL